MICFWWGELTSCNFHGVHRKWFCGIQNIIEQHKVISLVYSTPNAAIITIPFCYYYSSVLSTLVPVLCLFLGESVLTANDPLLGLIRRLSTEAFDWSFSTLCADSQAQRQQREQGNDDWKLFVLWTKSDSKERIEPSIFKWESLHPLLPWYQNCILQ